MSAEMLRFPSAPAPTQHLRALLIGEAWGNNERLYEHPFVGRSGVELMQMISQAGLAPPAKDKYPSEAGMKQYWQDLRTSHRIGVSNVFSAQPTGNNLELFFSNDATLAPRDFLPPIKKGRYVLAEHHHHIHRLWAEIHATQPNLLILLGNAACWAVLRQVGIMGMRGCIIPAPEFGGAKCLPVQHPASILRQWSMRPIAVGDFQKAAKHIDTRDNPFRRERIVNLNPTFEEMEEWFAKPAKKYTVDIESGYALYTRAEINAMRPAMRFTLSSQISMVGFARSPEDAIVISFMTRNSDNLSYYADPADEKRAWKVVAKALASSPEKIFQNGLYDMNRLMWMGIPTRNAKHDTMLRHHAMYPEMQKSLGFMGSIYCDESAWKLMYKEGESLKRDD